MTIYGGFSIPTFGMQTQSYSLNVIGNNIANVNTGGYKRTDVRFETLLSQDYTSTGYDTNRVAGNSQSDIGGVLPKDYLRVAKQGFVAASTSDLDVAINGNGYFILNTEVDGSGQTYYSRDGNFQMKINGTDSATADDGSAIDVSVGYLADKNGYYVMGWTADAAGQVSGGSVSALRIDQFAFVNSGTATTQANLDLNLKADEAVGGAYTYNCDVYDSEGHLKSVAITFTKDATNQEWTVAASTGNVLDTVNSANGTLVFDSLGAYSSGSPFAVDIAYAGGETVAFNLDLSQCTQFSGQYNPVSYTKDGFIASNMTHVNFDSEGNLIGTFEDNSHRVIYQLPLALFTNPEGMHPMSGMVFQETDDSGEAEVVDAVDSGHASFTPNARELSNVDLADQFTKLMLTQTAYNSSATAFKTMDEMLQDAKTLKG